MSKFVHLHVHSHYSLLDGVPKIPDLVKRAKKEGMEALALTDSGNLYGAIEFYKECRKEGVKPIIGVDFYVVLRTRHDKEARIDNQRTRLILLAENLEGYHNLLKLVTASYLEGFYYKPRIDKELVEKHKAGLVAILPSFVKTDVEELALFYQKVFGPERFSIELTHHPEIIGHDELMAERKAIAAKHGIALLAAHDVYYLDPEDKTVRDTVLAIQGYMSGSGAGRVLGDEEEDFSFISTKTAAKYFKDVPEALENTAKVAEMCNLELELGTWVFPNLEIGNGKTPEEAFRDIVEEGFAKRGLAKTPAEVARVEYELKIINDKGYPKYLLIVTDLLRYAHEHGILTNVRGSVAGSLVSYLTGITNINPLEYKLPFERFLNPDRPSAPDIDMDFADNRRDEVIEYARRRTTWPR
ncbi:PHP domain-containing protein [Candidatus Parcubacteria bacterium]|nr:PHP domain-containing protein [Candidatus Parcubacteria bacterium]